ncbi:MAG: L-lactate dehydrogenase [Hyphomonadaceae bacterium]
MPTLNLAPASPTDYRRLAEKRLPRPLFDYLDGGACDEQTLRANTQDFNTLALEQRVLRDVSKIDTSLDLYGETIAMPLALSPIGLGGMMARRAEVQAVRAANAFGIPFCLSTVSICSMEEVAKAAVKPFWFQLYMLRDRGHVEELLQRAKDVGCTTLVFTVDLAVVGARYRDIRNGMGGNISAYGKLRGGLIEHVIHPAWALDVGIKGKPHTFGNISAYVPDASTPGEFKLWLDDQIDPSVTWKDIEWLRGIWDGKLIIKGVLNADDAVSAVNAGANAVIVSNHGGRQLDGVFSTIRILPRIVDAIGERADVIVDGGVRSGQDIVKALALGARAAMIGRPWIWALAAQGETGLTTLLKTFQNDMKTTMALTAAPTISDISPALLANRLRID